MHGDNDYTPLPARCRNNCNQKTEVDVGLVRLSVLLYVRRGCLSVCQLCIFVTVSSLLPTCYKKWWEALLFYYYIYIFCAAACTSRKQPFIHQLDCLCFSGSHTTYVLLLSSLFFLHGGSHQYSRHHDPSKTSTKTYNWYIPDFLLHIYLVLITAVYKLMHNHS